MAQAGNLSHGVCKVKYLGCSFRLVTVYLVEIAHLKEYNIIFMGHFQGRVIGKAMRGVLCCLLCYVGLRFVFLEDYFALGISIHRRHFYRFKLRWRCRLLLMLLFLPRFL